ncbi:hypothetical protein [Desulfoluna sp.]|uniref:hypothetical protein n=1 Tax=Desulfoluna sp. TaxID=2045199 RepID=UPI00262BB0C0|nr:hypothetical protein [Desulfoluna sp.]
MKPSNLWLLIGAIFLLIGITVLVLTFCRQAQNIKKKAPNPRSLFFSYPACWAC